jgi:hypothetical protein
MSYLMTIYQQFPSTVLNHLEIQQIRKHAGFLLVEHLFTWKKKSKQVPFLYTQDFIFWYIFFIIFYHLPEILLFRIFTQRQLRLTLSNALLKSTNVQKSRFFFVKYKSARECEMKILSVVECIFLNPVCDSEISCT